MRAKRQLQNECCSMLVRNCAFFAQHSAAHAENFAGLTKTVGEVHDGDTVTDFLEAERERGITISSAAITFPWSTDNKP